MLAPKFMATISIPLQIRYGYIGEGVNYASLAILVRSLMLGRGVNGSWSMTLYFDGC